MEKYIVSLCRKRESLFKDKTPIQRITLLERRLSSLAVLNKYTTRSLGPKIKSLLKKAGQKIYSDKRKKKAIINSHKRS